MSELPAGAARARSHTSLGAVTQILAPAAWGLHVQVILEGEMDIMAVSDDVSEQARQLTNTQMTLIVYKGLGHMDFVSGGVAGAVWVLDRTGHQHRRATC